MVITADNIQHYELMSVLADREPTQEPIIKVAATTKQSTLEENLLKLCSELRGNGFDIYADSVEEKFLALKTADTHMYRVHDEDGEDLIEFAHPDGDHNVEDGELGDVETIVSQQKKMKAIVKKDPTGKLAQYVEMCRIVLADDGGKEDLERMRQNVAATADAIDVAVEQQGDLSWLGELPAYKTAMWALKRDIAKQPINTPDIANALVAVGNVKAAVSGKTGILDSLNPWSGVQDKELFGKLTSNLDQMTAHLTEMKALANKIYVEQGLPNANTTATAPTATIPEWPLRSEDRAAKVSELSTELAGIKAQLHQVPADKQQAMSQWIDKTDAQIKAIKTQKDYEVAKSEVDSAR